STMKSRRGFAIQRLMNAMRQAHADGWFIVFDTLTLADDRLEAFYDNPNALRDYLRDIGRMVLAAEGRKANDSHADCYQYFCVPEYGTANGRLHFHAVHFMRTLPTGSVDPNFGQIGRAVQRNAETDLVCRLLLEKKKKLISEIHPRTFVAVESDQH